MTQEFYNEWAIQYTLDVMGANIFAKGHMLPPKTKKAREQWENELATILYYAQALTGNESLTEQDLINISINKASYRDYMKPENRAGNRYIDPRTGKVIEFLAEKHLQEQENSTSAANSSIVWD